MAVGQFNERIVLQAIRLHGPLPQAEIARITQLTAQAVSLIVSRLQNADLLMRLTPVRGKVGQPSVPIALNADGAFSIGVHLAARRMEVLLVDFAGHVRQRSAVGYRSPRPADVLPELADRLRAVRRDLGAPGRRRLQGVGVAATLQLGDRTGAQPEAPHGPWRSIDLAAEVAALSALPALHVKEGTAACVAELAGGQGASLPCFLHVFVDSNLAGSLVVDGHLHGGLQGLAGNLGALSLGRLTQRSAGRLDRLGTVASLDALAEAHEAAGLDPAAVADERVVQKPWRVPTTAWLRQAAAGLATAVHSAACLLDLDAVVIDGAMGRPLLAALLAEVDVACDRCEWDGMHRPPVLAGTVGADAPARGAAWLPLHAQFAPDRDAFLKTART